MGPRSFTILALLHAASLTKDLSEWGTRVARHCFNSEWKLQLRRLPTASKLVVVKQLVRLFVDFVFVFFKVVSGRLR